jgi:hypothetical protein
MARAIGTIELPLTCLPSPLMKPYPLFFLALLLLAPACRLRRSLLKDTVVLHNGNSFTGTIYAQDSARIKVVQHNLATEAIQVADIDTIIGYKLRTGVLGISSGVFHTPYYSIFRGEPFNPTTSGIEVQWGAARFRHRYRYVSFSYLPARPFVLKKWTVGWHYYFWKDYTAPFTAYLGLRSGLMDVEFNNIPQFFIEPYGGAEWKLHPQWRAFGQWSLQRTPIARNNRTGTALQVGLRFYMRHLDRRYAKINQEIRR